jgi:hypothetical protein
MLCHDHHLPPTGPLLGVVGIFSHEPRRSHRAAIRASWLAQVVHPLHARFVMRGLRPMNETVLQTEVESHRDVILLDAPSNMSRSTGPLKSLLLWFECAADLYDTAFIGKADDVRSSDSSLPSQLPHLPLPAYPAVPHDRGSLSQDVWVRAEALSPMLRSAYTLLPEHPAVLLGKLESYYWEAKPNNEGPVWFGWNAWRPCLSDGHGPFPFAKGPLFFVSANASRAAISWAIDSGEAGALIDSDASRCYKGSRAMRASRLSRNGSVVLSGPCIGSNPAVSFPVEDVWLGHALSKSQLVGHALFIELDSALYPFSPWGFSARESIAVWHSNADTDFPRRASVLSEWASNASRPSLCVDWRLGLTCAPGDEWSCTRQPVKRCTLTAAAACSRDKIDMWQHTHQHAKRPAHLPSDFTHVTHTSVRSSLPAL